MTLVTLLRLVSEKKCNTDTVANDILCIQNVHNAIAIVFFTKKKNFFFLGGTTYAIIAHPQGNNNNKSTFLTGLSVPAFISFVMIPRTKSMVSWEIP